MPERYLYEYAVIRVLPKVEREEFVNAGVILFCKQADYINALYYLNEDKLRLFSSELDMDSLRIHLHIFDRVCLGDSEGGCIAKLDTAERFRWLTAVRSTSIQTSRPHPGFSDNLDETLQRLFQELVF